MVLVTSALYRAKSFLAEPMAPIYLALPNMRLCCGLSCDPFEPVADVFSLERWPVFLLSRRRAGFTMRPPVAPLSFGLPGACDLPVRSLLPAFMLSSINLLPFVCLGPAVLACCFSNCSLMACSPSKSKLKSSRSFPTSYRSCVSGFIKGLCSLAFIYGYSL